MDTQTSAIAELSAVTKTYGAKTVLDSVSCTVGPGEIVALLGPNGAGKTTLIGCLLGFLLPTSGAARLFGQPVGELSPALRGRTGFVPQKLNGFTSFRVGELIDYIGKFYAVAPGPPPAWLLDWAQLDMRARVKALSGGQRQRLSILLAMRHEPDLLVLDEPVASLDPQALARFHGHLARLLRPPGSHGADLVSHPLRSRVHRDPRRLHAPRRAGPRHVDAALPPVGPLAACRRAGGTSARSTCPHGLTADRGARRLGIAGRWLG
jgi:ABC-type multidrug transport system ATPase subunit